VEDIFEASFWQKEKGLWDRWQHPNTLECKFQQKE
jgi:hypothetical protein